MGGASIGRKRLIHGARYLDGFYYRSEIEAVLGTDYIPCCSTESDPEVYAGRLTRYLHEVPSFPRDVRYMLCGATGMIIQVRDMLLSAGVPFSNIVSEIYF
jgi:ferredoxin--NADP+ reductase